jgi:2-keto-3-deoxy-galactonokinase
MTDGGARLIGLDWGTSSLRAYRLGENGRVLALKTEPSGVLSVPQGDFVAAFENIADTRSGGGESPRTPAVKAVSDHEPKHDPSDQRYAGALAYDIVSR